MKNSIIAVLVLVYSLGLSCGQQRVQKQPLVVSTSNDIEVYYFHMTTRCSTCRAIEAEARKNVEMLYPAEFNSGKIMFTALNIEDEAGKYVGDQYGIKGQTLLIMKGNQKIDITKEAFLYAEGKPDKFREIIKEKVDTLLK